MKIKVAHCADIHLGIKNFEKNSEVKVAFADMLRLCKAENVDFLIISGDLLDDVTVSSSIVCRVKSELKSFGIKTIISPGNHDPFTTDSPYVDEDWPENVFIFKESKLGCLDFPEFNLKIWGGAFTSIYQRSTLLKNPKDLDEKILNIGVMHGTVTNGLEEYYNPISLSDIEKSGFDYLALGHIHKRSKISKIGNTFYSYSGSICSRGFGDTGEKGIYIGEISKAGVKLDFKKICKHTYEKITVDISGASSDSEAEKIILEKIGSLFGEGFRESSYEITLTGEISEDFVLDLDTLSADLNQVLNFVKLNDSTEAKIDLENLKFRTDFKSIFIKEAIKFIENSKSEEERIINKNALKLGLRAFEGEVIYRDN